MSLLNQPFFPEVEQYIDVQPYRREKLAVQKKERVRIEVLTMPPELAKRAIHFVMPCVHCGAPMHPFRPRQQGGRSPKKGKMFFGATCLITVRMGCSRSKESRIEVEAIRKYYGK